MPPSSGGKVNIRLANSTSSSASPSGGATHRPFARAILIGRVSRSIKALAIPSVRVIPIRSSRDTEGLLYIR